MAGVGSQGELRYQEEISVDLAKIQVHSAAFVGENAILQDPVEEPLAAGGMVIGPHRDKHQQPAPDRGEDGLIDPDFGFRNPLQQPDHIHSAIETPLSSKSSSSGKNSDIKPSFPPQSGSEQHQDRENLQPAEQH